MATLVYNNRPARAFNHLLNDMLRETLPATPRPMASFVPAADVLETPQGFELHLALPGVRKEALTIDFEEGQLLVTGERPAPQPAADAERLAPVFRRAETTYGSFRRSFRLPDTVNVKAIAAELTDGLLRITLPFDTEKVTRQQIAVR